MSGLYSEEMIYDEGYYEGLRVAWFLMFEGVHVEHKSFGDVLKTLAEARDAARAEFERHKEDDFE